MNETEWIHVLCQGCGKRFRAGAQHVGRQGKCPSCGSAITIEPTAETPASEGAGTPLPSPARASNDAPPGNTGAGHCFNRAVIPIVLGVFLLCALLFCALLYARISAMQQDVADSSALLTEQTDRINDLSARLTEMEQDVADSSALLTEQADRINDLSARLTEEEPAETDVSGRYTWSSRTSSGLVLDAPGSQDITIGQGLRYAGLTFDRRVTVSILEDGTLVVTEEGVIGKDGDGQEWESQQVLLDGKEVIAFFRAERLAEAQSPSGEDLAPEETPLAAIAPQDPSADGGPPSPEDTGDEGLSLDVDSEVQVNLAGNEERPIDIPVGIYRLIISTDQESPVLLTVGPHVLGAKRGDNIELLVERRSNAARGVILKALHAPLYGFTAEALMPPSGPPSAVLINPLADETGVFTVSLTLPPGQESEQDN